MRIVLTHFNSIKLIILRSNRATSISDYACNIYNEENCIAFSSKSSGWLTAGCSNFGPAVGGCGYDAMALGEVAKEKWSHEDL